MARLVKLYFEESSLSDRRSDQLVWLYDWESGQFSFDWLRIDTFDDSPVKAAWFTGTAMLYSAPFHGRMSLVKDGGEVQLRYDFPPPQDRESPPRLTATARYEERVIRALQVVDDPPELFVDAGRKLDQL